MREPDQGLKEACGVFGICATGMDAARATYFGLYALQHRGQESAGIATCDRKMAYLHRGMGLVMQVFNEQNLTPLVGELAIGHTRYSTTGASFLRNCQPYLIETMHGPLGVGHNGNLVNAQALRRDLLKRGVGLISSSDSEVITQMLAAPPPGVDESSGPDWEARISAFMAQSEAAYSLVVLTRDAVFGVRDPLGLRPLCVGEITGNNGASGFVVASESCALGTIGARYLREVEPGEIVRLDRDGLHSSVGRAPQRKRALCVFEYVYFARPDSLFDEQTVLRVRHRLGEQLWEESPVEADVVIGVPDSARPAANGYAEAAGLPVSEGLIKNRYIGRTFIQPDERLRKFGVSLKYNPVPTTLAGKRVVLVDDSIVRGNTAGPLVRLLREGGAREVHLRISSPPVAHPCYMGVDMPTRGELIAGRKSVEEIHRHVGADSLAYLSLEGMMKVVLELQQADPGHCHACFSGRYPVEVDHLESGEDADKLAFEGISEE